MATKYDFRLYNNAEVEVVADTLEDALAELRGRHGQDMAMPDLLGSVSLEPQAMLAPEARHWFGTEKYTGGS